MKTLQDKAKDLKNKQQQKKEDKKKDNAQTPRTPRTDIESQEPEPEPEPTADLM